MLLHTYDTLLLHVAMLDEEAHDDALDATKLLPHVDALDAKVHDGTFEPS